MDIELAVKVDGSMLRLKCRPAGEGEEQRFVCDVGNEKRALGKVELDFGSDGSLVGLKNLGVDDSTFQRLNQVLKDQV